MNRYKQICILIIAFFFLIPFAVHAQIPNKTGLFSTTPNPQYGLAMHGSKRNRIDFKKKREERMAKIITLQKKRLEHLSPHLRDRLEKKLDAIEQRMSSNGAIAPRQVQKNSSARLPKPSSTRKPRTVSSQSVIQAWAAVYSSPVDQDYAIALAVDGQGNVYVTGIDGPWSDTAVTVKYNASGNAVWYRYFFGYPSDVAVDNNGNVYVTGDSTIKYNAQGDVLWQRGGFVWRCHSS